MNKTKKDSQSVPYNLLLHPLLHRVLREMSAKRGERMNRVLIEMWLSADKEALDRYIELKREAARESA